MTKSVKTLICPIVCSRHSPIHLFHTTSLLFYSISPQYNFFDDSDIVVFVNDSTFSKRGRTGSKEGDQVFLGCEYKFVFMFKRIFITLIFKNNLIIVNCTLDE